MVADDELSDDDIRVHNRKKRMRAEPFYREYTPGWRARAKGLLPPRASVGCASELCEETDGMFSFNSRSKKQILFQAWRLVVKTIQLCAVSSELARIELHNKRRADSIWQANKSELVEMAYRELPNARRDTLQRMNVTELRERVRAHRASTRLTEEDPLMRLPTGLERLKKEELMAECLNRGIVVEEPTTRPKMIVAIKDDVQTRRGFVETAMEMEWTAIPANASSSRSSTSGRI